MTPWNTTTPRDDGVTTVRRSWRAEIIHPDGTVTVEEHNWPPPAAEEETP